MSTKVRGYREVILDELAKEEVLKKASTKSFVLTHTHDESPRPLYFDGPYTADVMNVLISYIQFESCRISMTVSGWIRRMWPLY